MDKIMFSPQVPFAASRSANVIVDGCSPSVSYHPRSRRVHHQVQQRVPHVDERLVANGQLTSEVQHVHAQATSSRTDSLSEFTNDNIFSAGPASSAGTMLSICNNNNPLS